MKIIYEADDGTRFDDRFDCEFYEESKRHHHLKNVTFYNKKEDKPYSIDGNGYDDWVDDRIYYECYGIDIHNDEELEDIIWLGKYTGWCEFYEFFNEPGHWIRKEDEMSNGYWEKTK